MAVKTITIDREAYELLSACKLPGESFSRVIKRTLRDERYTASHLLAHLDQILLGEDTVMAIESVVKERERHLLEPSGPPHRCALRLLGRADSHQ